MSVSEDTLVGVIAQRPKEITASDDDPSLLDLALSAEDTSERRRAFLSLLDSESWRVVLAPHVLSSQGNRIGTIMYADQTTFFAAAKIIAHDPEKFNRVLELAGARFSDTLLENLARQMSTEFIEPTLDFLNAGKSHQVLLLMAAMQMADPKWIEHEKARPLISDQLQSDDHERNLLMQWLADEKKLGDYLAELHLYPPRSLEQWSALGVAQLKDDKLFELAMATLPYDPSPMLYLLRLEPTPTVVVQRLVAAAKNDWLSSALEIAIIDGLDHPILPVLAEIGVRLGGRSLSTATAWVGASKLAKELLVRLATILTDAANANKAAEYLWIRRSAPSADRALEYGRRGEKPDPMDVATLVRQMRGAKVRELVREILSDDREAMIDTILHPLVAVNEVAAREVMVLCESTDQNVAKRAQHARSWTDLFWPPEDVTQEIPSS